MLDRLSLIVYLLAAKSIFTLIPAADLADRMDVPGISVDVYAANTTSSETVSKRPSKRPSPVCQPSLTNGNIPTTRILFGHMRKVGGTTLSTYLKKVIETYGL